MNESKPVEIVCAVCRQDTLLLRQPKYEGFTRTGETLICSACGHVYDNEEEIPFKQRNAPRVFTEADRPAEVLVFREEEKGRNCRHCAHYTVNPFTQWCGHHRKEVQATDTCPAFAPRPPPKPAPI